MDGLARWETRDRATTKGSKFAFISGIVGTRTMPQRAAASYLGRRPFLILDERQETAFVSSNFEPDTAEKSSSISAGLARS